MPSKPTPPDAPDTRQPTPQGRARAPYRGDTAPAAPAVPAPQPKE
jgi:hypothetical protein